jgi:hypothetical protein
MSSAAPRLLYWDDFYRPEEIRMGPFRITLEQIRALRGVVGLLSDWAATGPGAESRVPDLFLHAFCGGTVWAGDGYLAIVCIRSATYEPQGYLQAGEEFFVFRRIVSREALDERLGVHEIERRVITSTGRAVARARTRMLMLRRAEVS